MRLPLCDCGDLLPRAPRGGPRDGRREDARDGGCVPGLEARPADADARVVRRLDHRPVADRHTPRRHEVRAPVRHVPRARRCGGRVGRPRAARVVPRNILMQLTPSAYAFLGVTVLVAALVAVVVFAMLRFAMAARDTRRTMRSSSASETVLSTTLQEAV